MSDGRMQIGFKVGKYFHMQGYKTLMFALIRSAPSTSVDLFIVMATVEYNIPNISKERAIDVIDMLCRDMDGWSDAEKQPFIDDYLERRARAPV
jgi:hypothetical protein